MKHSHHPIKNPSCSLRASWLRASWPRLALVALVATAAAAADAPTSSVLVGDFVDLGPGSRGMGRSPSQPQSIVRLVNETGGTVDVTLGVGSATLEPKQVLLARVDPGDVAVHAVVRGRAGEPLDGVVRVERGHSFALFFAMRSPDDAGASAGAVGAPAGEAMEPVSGKRASSPRKTKSGRVDIGRRPRQ